MFSDLKSLFFGILIIAMVSGTYVDEPLLYDTFPPNFIWATATASYQIEGGWDADGNKRKLFAQESNWQFFTIFRQRTKYLGKWTATRFLLDLKIALFHQDVFTTNSSTILDGTSGKVACNSYELYQKDIEALQILNVYLTDQKIESQSNDNLVLLWKVSHYRFSISWPRVLPDGIGRVNQKGIDYYKRLISALKAANIQPIVSIRNE